MPFTPFHFGPGGVIHAVAPRQVSFIAFVAANVLMDIEPLYYMLTRQDHLHRFFHTYIGATLIAGATVLLFMLARKLASRLWLPDLFDWQSLKLPQVIAGAAAGSYSHIVLDSVMHADIRPLAPFSQANWLYLLVPIDVLHEFCLWAGVAAVGLLAARKLLKSYFAK
ncbi:MAG: hypothetical protein V4772_23585 [Pseudomonadota bacterium]